MMSDQRYQTLLGLGVSPRIAARMAKQPATEHPKPRIEIRADGSDEAEILLYDYVGFDPWGEGMSAKQFADSLDGIKDVARVNVRINSPGGDVWDGMAMYNMLGQFAGRVTTTIEGIAASAASIVAMAGNPVRAYQTSQMMIHDAWTIALGNEQELREVADVLSRVDGQIADVYAAKTGGDAAEFRALMDSDTYLTGTEAATRGLVDEVIEPQNDAKTADNQQTRRPMQRFDFARMRCGSLTGCQ